MNSKFEQLHQELDYTLNADERRILLETMAKVGSFEQLHQELDYTLNADERRILLEAIAKVGSFEQLHQVLDDTLNADERSILLWRIGEVGSFEQIKQELDYTLNADERRILLEGIAFQTSLEQIEERHKETPPKLGNTPKISRKQYDLFIAHASEDKDFVTPLAQSLQERELKVWYDDFVLKLGDLLRREIDKGLAQSRYGVVILSHNFFAKHWPQKELDGLVAKEQLGKKVILPVWHNIDKEEVASYSPTLADIIAVNSSIGIETVANKIIEAISS